MSGSCYAALADPRSEERGQAEHHMVRWEIGVRRQAMGFYQERVVPHLVNLAMRNRQLAPYRERIVRRAKGRVLEVGVGSGLNLPLYTDRVSEVLGLDPHPKLLSMASHKAATVPSKLIEGSAESIPLDRSSVDTVLTTWTLCTIPDVAMALSEMRRILKPNGQLLFVEHGLAPDDRVRRWQNRLTPWWRRIAGGCHLNRPIATLVEDAGFHISPNGDRLHARAKADDLYVRGFRSPELNRWSTRLRPKRYPQFDLPPIEGEIPHTPGVLKRFRDSALSAADPAKSAPLRSRLGKGCADSA